MIGIAILFVIFLSVTILCLETLPELYNRYQEALLVVEIFIVIFFGTELLLRLASSPAPHTFFFRPMNILDLVAILPLFIQFIATELLQQNSEASAVLAVLRVVRLARLFRVVKVSKYSKPWKIVENTMARSTDALTLLAFLGGVIVVVVSGFIYYAERGTWNEDQRVWYRDDGEVSPYQSIPHSFYWAIITLTTVGYGDQVPVTIPGKMVACVTAMTGVIIIAFPITIIGANFVDEYQKMRGKAVPSALSDMFFEVFVEFGPESKAFNAPGDAVVEDLRLDACDYWNISPNDAELQNEYGLSWSLATRVVPDMLIQERLAQNEKPAVSATVEPSHFRRGNINSIKEDVSAGNLSNLSTSNGNDNSHPNNTSTGRVSASPLVPPSDLREPTSVETLDLDSSNLETLEALEAVSRENQVPSARIPHSVPEVTHTRPSITSIPPFGVNGSTLQEESPFEAGEETQIRESHEKDRKAFANSKGNGSLKELSRKAKGSWNKLLHTAIRSNSNEKKYPGKQQNKGRGIFRLVRKSDLTQMALDNPKGLSNRRRSLSGRRSLEVCNEGNL